MKNIKRILMTDEQLEDFILYEMKKIQSEIDNLSGIHLSSALQKFHILMEIYYAGFEKLITYHGIPIVRKRINYAN